MADVEAPHDGMEISTTSFVQRRGVLTRFVMTGGVLFLTNRGRVVAALIPATKAGEVLSDAAYELLDRNPEVTSTSIESTRSDLPLIVAEGGAWYLVNHIPRMAIVPEVRGRAYLDAKVGAPNDSSGSDA